MLERSVLAGGVYGASAAGLVLNDKALHRNGLSAVEPVVRLNPPLCVPTNYRSRLLAGTGCK